MAFDIHNWQIRRANAQYQLLQEEKQPIQFPIEGQNLSFDVFFYEGEGNFYYQFLPKSNEVLDLVDQIGKQKVTEEIAKFIEIKTTFIAPFDESVTGAGMNFKILPSELKDYMLSPFK